MKKFIACLLSGVTLMSTATAYGYVEQTITAIFNKVSIFVDGTIVPSDTLLYNGTTYVPLRSAAEILGKEVSYDAETSTAYIGKVPNFNNTNSIASQEKIPKVKVNEMTHLINDVGNGHLEATYTNKSKYPITHYSMELVDRTTKEKQYLSSYDTVLPNETSPKFDCYFDSSMQSGYDIVKISYDYIDNKKTKYVEYDFKLLDYTEFF